ncbi:MAG: LytR/AlgR family response regulator transcription factor [Flavisolibacter sp.]
MKWKCIIVDDEPVARKILQEYIEDIDFLELVGKAENPLKAGSLLQSAPADIIFLDINMPRMSGIEFLKTNSSLPLTIMTTAYSEYAVEGFDLNVLDYIVKPFSFERFMKACNKARDYLLLSQKKQMPIDPHGYFFVKSNGIIEKIMYDELLSVEAMQNYVVLHTATTKRIVYLTMKGISEYLPESMFLKIHKSTIININKIKNIEGYLVNLGTVSAIISQNLYDTVMKSILKDKMIKR